MNNPNNPMVLSKDDLESLTFLLAEFERTQYAVRLLQNHFANKYKLTEGDRIDVAGGGVIVRSGRNSQNFNPPLLNLKGDSKNEGS